MAGSGTYRQYDSDDGNSYTIRVDESNARGAVTGGDASPLCAIRTTDPPPLPRGMRPRYVLAYNSAKPVQRRRFYVGDKTQVSALLAPGSTITAEQYPGAADTAGSNVTWVVTFFGGEKWRKIPSHTATDTGLTDGTSSQ